jgi:hypothetical protein
MTVACWDPTRRVYGFRKPGPAATSAGVRRAVDTESNASLSGDARGGAAVQATGLHIDILQIRIGAR